MKQSTIQNIINLTFEDFKHSLSSFALANSILTPLNEGCESYKRGLDN